MKTNSITRQIFSLVVFALMIFNTTESISQQTVTFKDGTKLNVIITCQTKDTLKYYLESQPTIIYVERMDRIDRISPVEHSEVFQTDSLARISYSKKYSHYLHMTIGGPIIFTSGCVLAGFGIAGLVSLSDDDGYDELTKGAKAFCGIVTAVGVVGVIAGIAMTVSGATNMQKYKEKLNGFSFDFKYTPQVKGISLVYRF
jgi:hypothetical protein